MLVLLSSIAASLDGFIIGIGLKFQKIKLTKGNLLTIFLGNLVIYGLALSIYYYFHFTFVNKLITTILFFILAINAFFSKEDGKLNFNKNLTLGECILLTLTHSLDGTLVSLGFVESYSILLLVLLFSLMSIFILLIGYYFAHLFKNYKRSNWISGFLFLILAFFNYFWE